VPLPNNVACPVGLPARTSLIWQQTTPLGDGPARTIAYFDQLLSEGGRSSVEPVTV